MWLLRHRRATILLCWSGSTLHFLTCQHGQAKHRAFWHRHFTSLILTDNSNRKEVWHGVIPSGPPSNLCAVLTVWGRDQCCLWQFCFSQVWRGKNVMFGIHALSRSCPPFWLFFDGQKRYPVEYRFFFFPLGEHEGHTLILPNRIRKIGLEYMFLKRI